MTYAPGTDGSPAQNIIVSDDKCSTVNPVLVAGFNAGDADADNRLDAGETWRYTCAYTVPAHADGEADPLVNTATVSGKDLDGDAVTATRYRQPRHRAHPRHAERVEAAGYRPGRQLRRDRR